MKTLYLASKSAARRDLLMQARIPFFLLEQDANESLCDWGLTLERVALSVAEHKMQHALTPQNQAGNEFFVLTADTVVQDKNGLLYAKPENYDHAFSMMRSFASGTVRVATAFVVEKRVKRNDQWIVNDKVVDVVVSQLELEIDDFWIKRYLEMVPEYLSIAGALQIEGFGSQFIKKIDGSYSGILGLPLCEVRQALEKLRFFE